MSGIEAKGLLQVLQEGAQSVLSSGAAVLSDLQQQLSTAANQQRQKQAWTPLGSSHSSHSSSSFSRRLLEWKEETVAHLRWSTPLLQPTTRVPLPAQWDAPTILAFLDCLKSVQLSFVTVAADNLDDGSSSSYLTIPPVTAALVAGLLLVFTRPGGVALRDVALSPYCVLQRKEYWRLLSCHVVHLDAAHLLTNLSSLMPDCAKLEAAEGSVPLALDLLLLAGVSSCAYTAAAVLHKSALGQPSHYYSMLTVGASSLGFALKVWSGYRCRRGCHHVLGLLPIPAHFSWVPTLALTHLLVPQASFPAHLAGVCAGLCRAYAIEPVFLSLKAAWRTFSRGGGSSSGAGRRLGGGEGLEQPQPQRQQQQQQQNPLHTWRRDQHRQYLDSTSSSSSRDEGTGVSPAGSSERPCGGSSGSNGSWRGRDGGALTSSSNRGGMWRTWLLPSTELMLQLGCLGAAVGVYLVCTSSSGQQGRGYNSYSGSSDSSSSGWKRW